MTNPNLRKALEPLTDNQWHWIEPDPITANLPKHILPFPILVTNRPVKVGKVPLDTLPATQGIFMPLRRSSIEGDRAYHGTLEITGSGIMEAIMRFKKQRHSPVLLAYIASDRPTEGSTLLLKRGEDHFELS